MLGRFRGCRRNVCFVVQEFVVQWIRAEGFCKRVLQEGHSVGDWLVLQIAQSDRPVRSPSQITQSDRAGLDVSGLAGQRASVCHWLVGLRFGRFRRFLPLASGLAAGIGDRMVFYPFFVSGIGR